MPVTVRTAVLSDVPLIVEYNRRLALETENKTLDVDTVAAAVTTAMSDPDRYGPYYLACQGDDVVGQLQVTFEWSDWRNGWFWWVQSVYVRADARGQGVFRELLQHVRETARAAGNVIGIRLYVERENAAAQATYERLGLLRLPYLMMEEQFVAGYQLPS